MKQSVLGCALAGVVVLAGWTIAGPASAQDFTITSSAFQEGAWFQQKHTNKGKNCSGENLSPPLAWTNVPAKATSLALLMFDPEARGGMGVSQWVIYGIPTSVTGLAEDEGSRPSDKFVSGIGTNKQSTYQGPCTGPGPFHHYLFTLIATTHGPKDLPAGLTREQVFERSAGKFIGATGLVGRWQKK
jgi:Raf kinase inhibitor-like YbhB/YbcL family protein